jgi:hypothetical protein
VRTGKGKRQPETRRREIVLQKIFHREVTVQVGERATWQKEVEE